MNLFVRGGGMSLVSTGFDAVVVEAANADSSPDFANTPARTHRVTDSASSYYLSIGAGIAISPVENFGFQLEARQSYVPALENALGDKHDLGGLAVLLELRIRGWE